MGLDNEFLDGPRPVSISDRGERGENMPHHVGR